MSIRKIYDWMGSKVHSKRATFILGALFFIEAIFFLPTDPMLIFYCVERRDKALWYAFIATVSSVLGGLGGYLIGYVLWQTVGPQIILNAWLNKFISANTFVYLCDLYQRNAWSAVMIAGFTPVPYKAATLTAGFCNIALTPFIIGSVIARGARFFLFAIVIKIWGEHMKEFIDRYFNLLVVLTMILIGLALWLIK